MTGEADGMNQGVDSSSICGSVHGSVVCLSGDLIIANIC